MHNIAKILDIDVSLTAQEITWQKVSRLRLCEMRVLK